MQTGETQTPPAYPPYPPPGYFPQPPLSPPVRRSHRGLWITLIVLAVLIIGGLALLIPRAISGVKQGIDGSQAAVTAYFTAVKSGDWNSAHNLLDADLAAKTTPADLQATWQRRQQADGAIDHFTFGNTNVSNFNGRVMAQVNGTLVYQSGASDPKIITLVQEGGQWKLSSLP